MQDDSTSTNNVIHHINKIDKNHMMSIDAEKNFWQNSTSIYDKNSQSGYRESIPQHNKGHIWQTHN